MEVLLSRARFAAVVSPALNGMLGICRAPAYQSPSRPSCREWECVTSGAPITDARSASPYVPLPTPYIVVCRTPTISMIAGDAALADASMSPADLDAVLIVGGAARAPPFVELVEAYFGRAPLVPERPEECVALGAASHARQLQALQFGT